MQWRIQDFLLAGRVPTTKGDQSYSKPNFPADEEIDFRIIACKSVTESVNHINKERV